MELFAALINLDEALFFRINNLTHTPFLDWFFLFFSFYPLIIWMLIGLVVTFIEEQRDHWFIVTLGLGLLSAGFLSSVLIKPLVARPRPDLSHGSAVIIVSEKPAAVPFNNDFAFPSGHAAVAFAGAYILTRAETAKKHTQHSRKYKRVAGWIFYAFAAITAFSRIYLGKHYPLDVINGAFLGILVGWVSWWVVAKLRSQLNP